MLPRYQKDYIKNPYVFNSMSPEQNKHNYHQSTKLNNFMMNQKTTSEIYQNIGLSKSIDKRPQQNKISFIRDAKYRLPEFGKTQQIKKQEARQNYKKQLQDQIKADKQRKQKEKQKIENQETERERKFYAQAQIQPKQQKNKQEPSYIILRSGRGHRKKRNSTKTGMSLNQSQITEFKEKTQFFQAQISNIIKRGGYHNQSVLDNIHHAKLKYHQIQNPEQTIQSPLPTSPNKKFLQSEIQERQIQIIRQRNYEEQRINNIIRLQQKMLRKLDNFRGQILKTNKNLDLDKETQHIRNLLKSKPIKMEVWSVRNDSIFQNYKDFYHFPKLQSISQNKNRNRRHRINQSRIDEGINLNRQQTDRQRTLTQQNPQQYQSNDIGYYSIPKSTNHQIKLFNMNNDKNYKNQDVGENSHYQDMIIPVFLEKKDQVQSSYSSANNDNRLS